MKDVDNNNLETKNWNKSWIMLLISVIYRCQLCSFRYITVNGSCYCTGLNIGWFVFSIHLLTVILWYLFVFSDSDVEGEELAQPEFRGLWEEGVQKVSL